MEDQEADEAWLELGRTLDIPEAELTAPPADDGTATVAVIEERWFAAQQDLNQTYAMAREIEEQQKRWKDRWTRGPEQRINTMTQRVDMWRTFFRAYLGPERGPAPPPAVAEAVARIEAGLDASLAEWTKPDPAP